MQDLYHHTYHDCRAGCSSKNEHNIAKSATATINLKPQRTIKQPTNLQVKATTATPPESPITAMCLLQSKQHKGNKSDNDKGPEAQHIAKMR